MADHEMENEAPFPAPGVEPGGRHRTRVLAGLVPLVDSFRRFATEGLGTPAPVAPPGHLIVTGFYRHVRNPMYAGLVAIILGQALLFADRNLLWYAAIIWLSFHGSCSALSTGTRRSFGEQYDRFRENVPRWIPRLRGGAADPTINI